MSGLLSPERFRARAQLADAMRMRYYDLDADENDGIRLTWHQVHVLLARLDFHRSDVIR